MMAAVKFMPAPPYSSGDLDAHQALLEQLLDHGRVHGLGFVHVADLGQDHVVGELGDRVLHRGLDFGQVRYGVGGHVRQVGPAGDGVGEKTGAVAALSARNPQHEGLAFHSRCDTPESWRVTGQAATLWELLDSQRGPLARAGRSALAAADMFPVRGEFLETKLERVADAS